MKQTLCTHSNVLRLFPPEGVLQHAKSWDDYRSYLSSSHTSLYCPEGAQATWSPCRQRCVHALWYYLLRADCFCSSDRVAMFPVSPGLLKCSCGWVGVCSTWAAFYLCLWFYHTASLCAIAINVLLLHQQKLYATKRHKRAPCPSLLYPHTSSLSLWTELTAREQITFS